MLYNFFIFYNKLCQSAHVLINADIYNPVNVRKISFSFLDLKFDNPDSIFYFKDEIRFAGGLWENLYKS